MNRCEDAELEIYNALLLEEPEAHLHPQYQNTFFEYLSTLTDRGLTGNCLSLSRSCLLPGVKVNSTGIPPEVTIIWTLKP
jgi:hypothetical protein